MTAKKTTTRRKVVVKEEVPKVSQEITMKEVSPETATVAAPIVEKVKEIVFPVYDKKQVTRIIGEGHTRTHYHCEGLDGKTVVTFHVPRNLFA